MTKKTLKIQRLLTTAIPQGQCPGSLLLAQPLKRPHKCFENNVFSFLNKQKAFDDKDILWTFSEYGKLWTYNLNYFSWLLQSDFPSNKGCSQIENFISNISCNKVGLEPYPTSVRIINWIKFFAAENVKSEKFDQSLYSQALFLSQNIEYHLLGNHLLENAFSLFFAAYYFKNKQFYEKAKTILISELTEQILPDGGHFELSPMYHQILLERVLDSINLVRHNVFFGSQLNDFLEDKAAKMLGWLKTITFENGDIPLVNDAAFGIAPSSAELFDYAKQLGIMPCPLPLKECGYRKVLKDKYELLVDVGNIGPDYIPGHAHSDTFSFVLYVNGYPFIVDTGTSTYETCARRSCERGTSAHNTVEIAGTNQSEVWASFRVARRAKVRDLVSADGCISAWHDGYSCLGARHHRSFRCSDSQLEISDWIESKRAQPSKAFLHFHPKLDVILHNQKIHAGTTIITFAGAADIKVCDYHFAPGFNELIQGQAVEITFESTLVTRIKLD